MIFVTVGTHPQSFERLIKRIDEIAPYIKEKIIIQKGFTKYETKNCESFDFSKSLNQYFQEARVVISHGASSVWEFAYEFKKPILMVPRQKKFKEHINDHQVEFALFFSEKTGVKTILDEKELTPELLINYNKIAVIKKDNLEKLRKFLKEKIEEFSPNKSFNKPFAKNREDYLLNLINPSKKDKILNIGVSNNPYLELEIEKRAKEAFIVDIDGEKLEKAKQFLKKTKLIKADITEKPFKKNNFDKIVMIEVLEHIENDDSVLKWINNILKKNGSLIISVPNNAFLHFFNPVKYFQHKRHYSETKIKRMLEENGFQIGHFNLVECFTFLMNLYIHIFYKYFLRKNKDFMTFKKKSNQTYSKFNKKGLDIVIKAKKVREV